MLVTFLEKHTAKVYS